MTTSSAAATRIHQDLVDQHFDAVLRTSGSALKHYTMAKTREDMRQVMISAMQSAI